MKRQDILINRPYETCKHCLKDIEEYRRCDLCNGYRFIEHQNIE